MFALPQPYKGLQDSPDDDEATAIAGVTLAVRDQTQANYGADGGVPTTFAVEDPDGIEDDGFTVVFSAIDAVCVAEDEDDCAEMDNRESETTLEVVATARATGSFNDPFDGVDFWMMDVNGAHWKLPVTASVEAGRTDDRRADVDILGGSSCSHAAYDDQGGRFPAGWPPTATRTWCVCLPSTTA